MFEATVKALIKFYTYTNEDAVLSQILCERLQIDRSDRLLKGSNQQVQ